MKLLNIWHLDCFPPSLNHQTCHGNGRAWDSSEYRQFKEEIALQLRAKRCPNYSHLDGKGFSLSVFFLSPDWFTKKGKLKKRTDVSNRYKAVEDSIFKAIGVDDSQNVFPQMGKAFSSKKSLIIKLEVLEDDDYEFILDGDGIKANNPEVLGAGA